MARCARWWAGVSQGEGLFNRAVQAERQPGSSFKPFVYAAALDQGWRFDDLIYDGPISMTLPDGQVWEPENYSREFYGEVTLVDALRSSLNTAAVRLSETVGREDVARVAEGFGIEADLRALGPSHRAGRVGGDADRDGRRLCRHSLRRAVGDALRDRAIAAERAGRAAVRGAGERRVRQIR